MNTTTLLPRQLLLACALLLLLLIICLLSLLLGAKTIPPQDVWLSLTGQLHNADSVIVLDARLPRTLAGILAGLALGGAGAVIQALTRNPLADPGILGVNAGASFAIVIGITLFGVSGIGGWLLFGWSGALLASIALWLIGSVGGGKVNPVRLTLTGVALSAVLMGMTTSLMLINPQTFDQMRIWQVGTLDIRSLAHIAIVAPVILAGALLALVSARALNTLSMGEEIATALGTRVMLVRLLAVITVMILCGSTTALVGPIGFVGLMIPHVARWWFGTDQRWIVIASFLLAPILLLLADIAGRLVAPGELRVSIVTAFIGAPVLIWLVRQRKH